MASKRFFLVMVALLLVGGAYWLMQQVQEDTTTNKPTFNAVVQTINECDLITEKSAAQLTAIVEFQKLEIIGRKAAVFKRCMSDRGYHENPAWTKYAESLVTMKAKDENTSQDEAFENLRREKMKLTEAPRGEPVYWILR